MRALIVLLFGLVSGLASAQRDTTTFTNDVIVTNGASWPVTINVVPKHASLALQGSQFVLQPGASMPVANYTTTGEFESPVKQMTISGTTTNRRGKEKQVPVLMMEERRRGPTHRAWIYHVLPNGGGVGLGF